MLFDSDRTITNSKALKISPAILWYGGNHMEAKEIVRRVVCFSGVALACLISIPSFADTTPLHAMPLQSQMQFLMLPQAAQRVAQEQLQKMGHFDEARTVLDHSGRFFIVEDPVHDGPTFRDMRSPMRTISDTPISGFTAQGVPIFHSFPGATNVIYLNFLGGAISGTAWNDYTGVARFDALPYDPDNNNGFSVAEQNSMAGIWRRVAEDYAPWKVDVTTERPANFTTTTLTAMITKHLTASGVPMPSSGAGGIAYVDIFNFSQSAYYAPALIYYDNLAGGLENIVAEATTHELGHNFGLSHDGITNGSAYYGGAGTGNSSWGPIMGAPYSRSVTVFNNGDYAGANNHEDDLAILTAHMGLKVDDVPNTAITAAPLTKTNGTFSRSGLVEWYTDIDVFAVDDINSLTVSVTPYRSTTNTPGNNVDLALELFDTAGNRVVLSSPDDSSAASLSAINLVPGRYYIRVFPVGNPVTPYSVYGMMGQYDLAGTYTNAPPPPTSTVIYQATMATYPTGWTVNVAGTWQYGKPSSIPDPKGFAVVGTVINGTGLYPEPIANAQQLISKGFATVGYTSATLTFDRFLGIQADDVASVHACDAAGCTLLWNNNNAAVIDTAWQTITYTIPAAKLGKEKVAIRFGIGPVKKPAVGSSTSFGWNIKNFKITGNK